MPRHWIFVLLPYSDFNRGDVDSIFKKVEKSGRWLIGKKTVHKYQLSKGDKVLFYLAGDEGRKFIGSGELLAGFQKSEKDSEGFVLVGNLKLWENQPRISNLLDYLSFIRKKTHYGLYLQGGVISIPERDFKLVFERGSHHKKCKNEC